MNGPLWRPVYIGLGSNLDSPQSQVQQGIERLGELEQTYVVLRSALYRSAPMGPKDQPDFINAVVAIVTQLNPEALLPLLQAIEMQHGRDRSAEKWGPRTLDLDILSYSSVKIASRTLTLPHPGIAERIFVLLPWSEITPFYRVPGLATVGHLAEAVASTEPTIEKLD